MATAGGARRDVRARGEGGGLGRENRGEEGRGREMKMGEGVLTISVSELSLHEGQRERVKE